MPAVFAAESREEAGGRTDEADPLIHFTDLCLQQTCQFIYPNPGIFRILFPDLQADHPAERRVTHHAPVSKVTLIKALVIA